MPQKIDSILNGGREVCSSSWYIFFKKLIFSKKCIYLKYYWIYLKKINANSIFVIFLTVCTLISSELEQKKLILTPPPLKWKKQFKGAKYYCVIRIFQHLYFAHSPFYPMGVGRGNMVSFLCASMVRADVVIRSKW